MIWWLAFEKQPSQFWQEICSYLYITAVPIDIYAKPWLSLYTQSKYTTTLEHNWAKKWQDFLPLICPLPLTKNALSKLSRLTNKWRHSFQWKRRGTIGWNIFLRSIKIYRVFQLDMLHFKRLLGHQKSTFKS